MPRCIDDVNVNSLVLDGTVFSENRNPAFLFDISAIHHALIDLLIFSEGSGALEQLIDHRCLTVVYVGNDCNIANRSCHSVFFPELFSVFPKNVIKRTG